MDAKEKDLARAEALEHAAADSSVRTDLRAGLLRYLAASALREHRSGRAEPGSTSNKRTPS